MSHNRNIPLTLKRVEHAASSLRALLPRSPLVEVATKNKLVALKLESELPTGSFKIRGAYLTVLEASEGSELATGSTGNFGKALAYAGAQFGISVHVFTPRTTPDYKLSAIEAWGGKIHRCDNAYGVEQAANDYAVDKRIRYASAYNSEAMILAGATIALELTEQVSEPQFIRLYCPVGGGGLIGGLAAGLRLLGLNCSCVAVSPIRSTALYNAVFGKVLPNYDRSLADGLIGGIEAGSMTISLVRQVVDRWIFVSEVQIAGAIELLGTKLDIPVEGAGATALAGALEDHTPGVQVPTQVVGLVTGRNISISSFERIAGERKDGS